MTLNLALLWAADKLSFYCCNNLTLKKAKQQI